MVRFGLRLAALCYTFFSGGKMFFKGSRYEKVDTNSITDSTGRVLVYKKIRFIPPTQGVVGYSVRQGDRLDQIANRSFRDPQRECAFPPASPA